MKFDKAKSDAIAQQLLGMEFQMDARGQENKIDCYGILCHYFRQFGIEVPDYAIEESWEAKQEIYLASYASFARKLTEEEDPETGDILVFENVDNRVHVAVYLGDGRFIHCRSKVGTKIDALYQDPWNSKKLHYQFFRVSLDT